MLRQRGGVCHGSSRDCQNDVMARAATAWMARSVAVPRKTGVVARRGRVVAPRAHQEKDTIGLSPSTMLQVPGTTIYASEDQIPPSVVDKLKIIGVGGRGLSAIGRLMGNNAVSGGDFWAIDTDIKALGSCEAPHTIQLPAEDDTSIPAAELKRLAGDSAAARAVAAQRLPAGAAPAPATEGVAFILAGAGAVPGGSTMLLQLASYLRRAGYFVVAALTRPFDFEGRRRLEEADALIEAMCDVAQLTVVVAQGVLQRASAELTIQDASAIADNTLEYSARAVLWALGAPEVLQASQGGMAWHGRDLRQYKRLLSPPLERLLTCPGTAALGRGLASIPISSLQEAGLPSTLSTLAEDAVTAAADSPFLDAAMGAAGGVMVVLSLPPQVLHHRLDSGGTQDALEDPEKYAIRAAVQVAAATVLDLAGSNCHDVVACAHVRSGDWPHTNPDVLCLEATMLVLEDPVAQEAAAAAAGSTGYPYITPRRPAGAAGKQQPPQQQQQQQQYPHQHSPGHPAATAAPLLHSGGGAGEKEQQQQQQQARAPPAPRANWNAMSALAGGSAAAVTQSLRPTTPGAAAGGAAAVGLRPPTPGSTTSRPGTPGTDASGASTAAGPGRSSPGPAPSGRGSPTAAAGVRPPSAPLSRGASPFVGRTGSPLPNSASPAPPRPGSSAAAGGSVGTNKAGSQQQQQQQQQQQTPPPRATASPALGSPQLIPRMADRLVDSLVAQSLDLPPTAARWRHQQRSRQATPGRRGGGHFNLAALAGGGGGGEEDEFDMVPGAGGGGPVGGPPADLRSRVAGMLEQEREEGYESGYGSGDEDAGASAGSGGAGGWRG